MARRLSLTAVLLLLGALWGSRWEVDPGYEGFRAVGAVCGALVVLGCFLMLYGAYHFYLSD